MVRKLNSKNPTLCIERHFKSSFFAFQDIVDVNMVSDPANNLVELYTIRSITRSYSFTWPRKGRAKFRIFFWQFLVSVSRFITDLIYQNLQRALPSKDPRKAESVHFVRQISNYF